jgi:two-component system chemotaxis sensor kinase CheA
MTDEDEDFQSLFFVECEENLADLQERLEALRAGDREGETVNAAFRAVHSVKGGAAAFGFADLVGFAHDFETVMDRVRSGQLDLDPACCETLLRAGDVMAELVEAAREGVAAPAGRVEQVRSQLAALLGMREAAGGADGEGRAAKSDAGPEAGVVGEEAPAGLAQGPVAATVRIAPGPKFLLSGFDPLRIVRAARAHGLVSVAAEGAVPPIDSYAPGDCPLVWRLDFELEAGAEALRAFLSTYAYGAEVTLEIGGTVETIAADVGRVDPEGVVDLASDRREQAAVEPAPAMTVPASAAAASSGSAAPSGSAAQSGTAAPSGSAAQSGSAAPSGSAASSAASPPCSSEEASGGEDGAGSGTPIPEPGAPRQAAGSKATAQLRSLRVDLDRVDRLVNLVGEVLIAQAALSQALAEVGPQDDGRLKPLVETLNRQTRDLQESVMAIRAQPVRNVFARLPRVVRDLCDALGKEARLVMQGEDVEVDTTVIEELNEPLVHMLRNAMDHGLEDPAERERAGKPRQGTLTLAAEQRGGRVRIMLGDDGRGIDRARVLAKARAKGLVGDDEQLDDAAIDALIFHPGFSTAQEISSVSGRGVGMDVVRRKITALGGRCVVASQPGRGTTITITLPLTLAVMDGMAIRVEEQQFILPLANVVEALTVEPYRIGLLPDRSRVIRLRDSYLPVLSLRSALALPDRFDEPSTALVIDTETGGHVVLMVDDLLGQRQVVLKSLETNVGQIEGVGGATILGDGRVALVLDVPALFRLDGRGGGHEQERVH